MADSLTTALMKSEKEDAYQNLKSVL